MSVGLSKYLTLAYSAPAIPLALLSITFYVYLPKFYADTVGVSLGYLGTIILVSRFWDALIDPAIGGLSDRNRSKWGRRKPWIAISSFFLALSFLLLLLPELRPLWISGGAWFWIWSILFFLFFTAHSVPYEALGAELTFDYHERTKLFGFREGAVVLGTVFAGLVPFLLGEPRGFTGRLWVYGICYGSLLLLASFWCVSRVKEYSWQEESLPSTSIFNGVGTALSNRPFLVLLISYTVAALGGALPATLILFYVEHVLQSSSGSLFLTIYFLFGFVFLPMWILLARRFGKKEIWIVSMVVNTLAFAGVFYLGAGDVWLYGVLVAISGIGYGATLAIPPAMQADVIDLDELNHGVRREGQFIGLWSVSKKLAAALGAAVALQVLGAAGYSAEIPGSAEYTLRVLYAAIPCLCNIVAIVVAFFYTLDESAYQEISTKLAQRNRRRL